MKQTLLMALAALLVLTGCQQTRRVERPINDVHAMIRYMPASANVMSMATGFPGTSYRLESDGYRLVWHFMHQQKDYGRFIVTLEPDGADATTVTSHFEDAREAEAAGRLGFLRKMARRAGEASIEAALSGRPVDRAALEQEMIALAATNPMAAHAAAMETVDAEMTRMAPADPCERNQAARDRCATLERNRGSGGSQSWH